MLLLLVKTGGPEAGHWKKDLITWMALPQAVGLLCTEPVEDWATQALHSSAEPDCPAKLMECDSPDRPLSTWGPLKGLGRLQEKQHALGMHWVAIGL